MKPSYIDYIINNKRGNKHDIPNIPSFRLFLAEATEDKGTVKVRRHITTI